MQKEVGSYGMKDERRKMLAVCRKGNMLHSLNFCKDNRTITDQQQMNSTTIAVYIN